MTLTLIRNFYYLFQIELTEEEIMAYEVTCKEVDSLGANDQVNIQFCMKEKNK